MVDRGRLFDVSTDVCFVDRRNRVQTSSDHIALLPPDYTPGYWDVICQGGKENYDHGKIGLNFMLADNTIRFSYRVRFFVATTSLHLTRLLPFMYTSVNIQQLEIDDLEFALKTILVPIKRPVPNIKGPWLSQ